MPSDYTRPGYVYVAFNPETGLCKLGFSKNPSERERALGVEFAAEVKLQHTILCNWPGKLEAYLHRRFAAKRVAGEWFDLTADDVRQVQSVSSVMYKGQRSLGQRAEYEADVYKHRKGFSGYPVCESDMTTERTSRRSSASRSRGAA